MATFDLPDNIIQKLSTVLDQLHQVLPETKKDTDFEAVAFRWHDKQLKAIYNPKAMHLDDLKGIERQKAKILQNTEQFLHGLPANDILLTGSRGTGKSSIVRSLLTQYAEQGLRLIELNEMICQTCQKFKKLLKIVQKSSSFIVMTWHLMLKMKIIVV